MSPEEIKEYAWIVAQELGVRDLRHNGLYALNPVEFDERLIWKIQSDQKRESIGSRFVPDRYCKQGKCANLTTCCQDYCKLDEMNMSYIIPTMPK